MLQKKTVTLKRLLDTVISAFHFHFAVIERERILNDLERVTALRFLKICHDRQFDDDSLRVLAAALQESEGGALTLDLLAMAKEEGFSEILSEALSDTLSSWMSTIGVDLLPRYHQKVSEVLKAIAAP